MSRAFVKEDIDEPERVTRRRAASGLPPGALNLMTADGAQQLRMRLAELKQNPQNKADEVADLQGMLDAATIVEPQPDADSKAVVFGARVTLRQPDGGLETYRIVGVDEANLEPGNVSWVSPLGKALLAATVGQTVRVAPGNAPLGTVVRVR